MFDWLSKLINSKEKNLADKTCSIQSEMKAQYDEWLSGFGYKVSWYMMLESELTNNNLTIKQLANALNLTKQKELLWNDGIEFGYTYSNEENHIYISAPFDNWVYVISASDDRLDLLDNIIANYYAFGSYRVVDFVAWKQVKNNQIIRYFSQIDGEGIRANIGNQTESEAVLGFVDLSGLGTEQAEAVMYDDKNIEDESVISIFTEDDVIDICEHWTGINPTEFGSIPVNSFTEKGIAGVMNTEV